jgi:hypothetical protein
MDVTPEKLAESLRITIEPALTAMEKRLTADLRSAVHSECMRLINEIGSDTIRTMIRDAVRARLDVDVRLRI